MAVSHIGQQCSAGQQNGMPCKKPRYNGGPADGHQAAADVGDNENKKNNVMRGNAVFVHPNPRTDQQHRRAGGTEDIGDQRTDEQKNDVGKRCGLAFDADVNAAAHDEQRTDQRDEAEIIMCRVQHARSVVQNKNVIAERDRAQAEGNFHVMPQPPAGREQWHNRHGAEQQREGQN